MGAVGAHLSPASIHGGRVVTHGARQNKKAWYGERRGASWGKRVERRARAENGDRE